MLDFCNLADVLDSISTVHYIYKEKVKSLESLFDKFFERIFDKI